MERYDAVIIGGGIAGSVCGRLLAERGARVLIAEKCETPRPKACSGIQHAYFERLIGLRLPRERLCANQIRRTEIHYPDGRVSAARYRMLNFMRDVVDDYLNQAAAEAGALFLDRCAYTGHSPTEGGVVVSLEGVSGPFSVEAEYLVDASGLRPAVRRRLRPSDFVAASTGATINYYIEGDGALDRQCLYQFWDLRWCNQMFAWVYSKTVRGAEYWVVGSGYDRDVAAHCEAFLEYVRKGYGLGGAVAWKEGYSTSLEFSSGNKVWLGEGRVLAIGDAAGLVDTSRGVGMDSAALSARLAASAIAAGLDGGSDALGTYAGLARRLVAQAKENKGNGIQRMGSNAELADFLRRDMPRAAFRLFFFGYANRFRSPERIELLP